MATPARTRCRPGRARPQPGRPPAQAVRRQGPTAPDPRVQPSGAAPPPPSRIGGQCSALRLARAGRNQGAIYTARLRGGGAPETIFWQKGATLCSILTIFSLAAKDDRWVCAVHKGPARGQQGRHGPHLGGGCACEAVRTQWPGGRRDPRPHLGARGDRQGRGSERPRREAGARRRLRAAPRPGWPTEAGRAGSSSGGLG